MRHRQTGHVDVERGADDDEVKGARPASSSSLCEYVIVIVFCILLLISIDAGLSMPPEEVSTSKFLRARLHDRFHVMRDRLNSLATRQRRLHEDRERRVEHAKLEELQHELDAQVAWNKSTHTWEHPMAHNVAANVALVLTPEHNASTGLQEQPGIDRVQLAPSPVPPPPSPLLAESVLLRFGLEGGCLHYQEPLELLARAVCDYDREEQRFAFDASTRTLRLASDPLQCVDFFVRLNDFGMWPCFDAGNDEFFHEPSSGRYCMQLDHDKCVRALSEADEAMMLRVPGAE